MQLLLSVRLSNIKLAVVTTKSDCITLISYHHPVTNSSLSACTVKLPRGFHGYVKGLWAALDCLAIKAPLTLFYKRGPVYTREHTITHILAIVLEVTELRYAIDFLSQPSMSIVFYNT